MARSKRGRPRKRKITIKSKETNITLGLVALIIAGLFILSLFIEAPGFTIFKQYLGFGVIIGAIFFLNWGLKFLGVYYNFNSRGKIFTQLLLTFTFSGFLHVMTDYKLSEQLAQNGEYGGIVGYQISNFIINIFSRGGAFFILLVLVVALVSLSFKISIKWLFNFILKIFDLLKMMGLSIIKGLAKLFKLLFKGKFKDLEVQENQPVLTNNGKKMVSDLRGVFDQAKPENPKQKDTAKKKEKENEPIFRKPEGPGPEIREVEAGGVIANEKPLYQNWKLPPLELLDKYVKEVETEDNTKKNADIIEETLDSFGIQARVVQVAKGPTVTQYALNIALGTKVSKISNLKADLALALAAPSGAIRIEAPIPGTSYVGIEIPNSRRRIVKIREVMETLKKQSRSTNLDVTVGKNINGQNVITNLQKMPHLLIAGATGSGKSVVTNSFIISLLMTKTPDEVRFIMVDPKQVELSFYNGIPHLLTPVIVEMDKVVNSLKWTIAEMERRYTLFRQAKVKNLQGYNAMMGFTAIPYIVIVIDEMADLMLSKGVDVENSIVRLAQKARATGIHLVLATQRPSVDVLTGLIKANIPGRLGMSVATQIDSRVIIDINGAETLLGKGDMLFKEPDKSKPFRIQGVWVSEEEIDRVVTFIKDQIPEVQYTKEITESEEDKQKKELGEMADFSEDNLFQQALSIVMSSRKASSSMLQRKLKIGYNRAARLIDEMYEAGVVGPPEGSKPRDVLIHDINQLIGRPDENETLEG